MIRYIKGVIKSVCNSDRRCPYCKKLISDDMLVCPYCNKELKQRNNFITIDINKKVTRH